MAKPTLLIWYMYDKQHGGGHKHRCQALAALARRLGYGVEIISNDTGAKYMLPHNCDVNCLQWNLEKAVSSSHCDWLIVDLEEATPEWVARLRCKKCNLNGPGYIGDNGTKSDQKWADLVWVQDTPETIILRQTVLDARWNKDSNVNWFVFGGSADPLGLLPKFDTAAPRLNSYLIGTKLQPTYTPQHKSHMYVECAGDNILFYMARAKAAVQHLGIAVWELARMSNSGIMQYVFSRSAGHLYYAQKLEAYGYVRAWPEIGLPDDKAFLEFITTPYTPSGPVIDGKAAERLLKLLK